MLLKSPKILNIFNRKEENDQDKSDQVESLTSDVEQLINKPVTSQNG